MFTRVRLARAGEFIFWRSLKACGGRCQWRSRPPGWVIPYIN
jgi:hypothetical protein